MFTAAIRKYIQNFCNTDTDQFFVNVKQSGMSIKFGMGTWIENDEKIFSLILFPAHEVLHPME